MITAVIPSCTDEFLARCLTSLTAVPSLDAVVAVDTGLMEPERFGRQWGAVVVEDKVEPFCFSRAINVGARAAPPGSHLFVMNDDAEVWTPDWRQRFARLLGQQAYGSFGMISPVIHGAVGNQDQRWDTYTSSFNVKETRVTLCFVAVLIRAECWAAAGEMDERFVAYGFEDGDYTIRVREKGWLTGVTNLVEVNHYGDGRGMHGTYGRKYTDEELADMFARGGEIFTEKYPQMTRGHRPPPTKE